MVIQLDLVNCDVKAGLALQVFIQGVEDEEVAQSKQDYQSNLVCESLRNVSILFLIFMKEGCIKNKISTCLS